MNRTRLIAATALAPLLWGTTYIVTTELLPPDRPLLASVARALPAGLVLLAMTRTLPRGSWWWRSAILGTLNIGAFFVLLFVSAYRLPGGVSATLGAVHPLIVAVLAVVVLREPARPRTFFAAALGLAGVALLVLTPEAGFDAVGVAAGLLAGASTAAGVILTKRWGRPVDLVSFTGWQLVWGGIVVAVPMLAFEGLPPALTGANVLGLTWLIVAGAIVSYLLWFRGVLALPAGQVSALAFLAPLMAATLGWLALGQQLGPAQLLGGAVIVASVGLAQWAPRRSARHGVPAHRSLRRRADTRHQPSSIDHGLGRKAPVHPRAGRGAAGQIRRARRAARVVAARHGIVRHGSPSASHPRD